MDLSPSSLSQKGSAISKKMMTTVLTLLLSAGVYTSSFAITLSQIDNDIQAIINGSSSSVSWSVLIENEYQTQTYFDLNSTTPRRPASNTKIFSTAAAFLKYGPNHTWNGYTLGSSSNSSPVHSILTSSNNGLADSLFSHVGGESASISELSAITSTTGMNMDDGSGLDYDNRFTCRQTIDVTRYMMNNYTFNNWGTHLAVGCQTGTLGSRFCGTDGSGNVFAKTGTLTNGQTLSLSGYVDNPYDNERYYFSIYCNNVPSQFQSGTRARIDNIVKVIAQSGIPNPGQNLGGIVVDNGTSGYSETGNWGTSSGAGYYGSNSRWASTYSGNNTAKWTPTISTQGIYGVYVWYVSGSNRSPAASYDINHLNGTTLIYGTDNNDGIINGINQKSNGGQWIKLGSWEFGTGTAGNVLLDSVDSFNGGLSNTVASADAVQFVLEEETVSEIIVDNSDGGYSDSGNWFTSTYTGGYYGPNYGGRLTASTSDAATWSANITAGGSYEVFTRWTAGSSRASSAPYIVYHTGGSTTVSKNQQANNGTWVSLGTFNFATGTSTRVALSCWTSSGTYVISDAIKLVKQ